MSSECEKVIKGDALLSIPGFSSQESASAICRAVDYSVPVGDLETMIRRARTTRWPGLSKAVDGGEDLKHVVSVDNAAGYAELWHKGGSWYAVTGAVTPDPTGKVEKSDQSAIYQIPKVTKGMPLEAAAARFATALFGPLVAKGSKDCNCGGGKAAW